MRMKILSLSDQGLADSNKSLKVYVSFLMGKMRKGLAVTVPTGKMLLRLPETTIPLFFHKGMVANLRADDRGLTCREALVLELARQFAHRLGNDYDRVYLTLLEGVFATRFTETTLTNFIKDFVHKRDGRNALVDTGIKVEFKGENGKIVFPTLDTYTGDALTSPAMLTWLLRDGQHYILNTRNNYDNLTGVLNRFKRNILGNGMKNLNTHSLFLWLALFLTPAGNDNQIFAIDNYVGAGADLPNGPISLLSRMNLKATMQNVLYQDGGINRLAGFTNNFDPKLVGNYSKYTTLKSFEKYIK